jgi:hypothetical protein
VERSNCHAEGDAGGSHGTILPTARQ